MQIRGTATPAEIQEAIRLLRPKRFWLKFFLGNWYASLIAILIIGVDINLLLQGRTPKWVPSAIMLAVCAALFGYSWLRWNTRVSNALRKATGRIESLSLETAGVEVRLGSGASTSIPWSSYDRWVEGKSIFLLTGKDENVIIPVDDGNRTAIRGLLATQVR